MPTKTILINDLLEKYVGAPVDWSFGMFPFWGWYHFVQTVNHPENLTIKNVTLNLEIKTDAKFWGVSWGKVCFAFKFNDYPIGGEEVIPPGFPGAKMGYSWWTGTRKTLQINVTEAYRKLKGTTPQVLTVGLFSTPPGVGAGIISTAYLDIEYEGGAPTPTGGGSEKEAPATATLGELMNVMLNMMLMMMFMSMMISMMGMVTEMM